jgi:hypothetical protein
MVGQAAASMKGSGFDKSGSCPNNPRGFGCLQNCKGHGVVKCWTCGKPVADHPTTEMCLDYDPKLDREGVPYSGRGRKHA